MNVTENVEMELEDARKTTNYFWTVKQLEQRYHLVQKEPRTVGNSIESCMFTTEL